MRKMRKMRKNTEMRVMALPDGAAAEGGLSMRFVQRLVDAVEQTGIAREEFLRALELDPQQLAAADARVPRSRLHHIFELALEHTGDAALGLHWAEGLTQAGFAPLTYLIAHVPSLRAAFETLASFQQLAVDGPCFELVENGDQASVRCHVAADARPHVQRFATEMIVSAFARMSRFFSGRSPARVCFVYPAPLYVREYTRIFERSERFEQPFNGIVLDRSLLDQPSLHKDEDMYLAVRTLAERNLLQLRARVPYSQQVQQFLVQQVSPRTVDMTTVARSLGLSVRSLRRRLVAEGNSYKSVENAALASIAKRLLRERQCTIREAAFEMGFSDTTTFHRAFRLWTGTTPAAYRAS